MDREKSAIKRETITIRKGDIDPGVKEAFRRVCHIRGMRVGEMLDALMEQKVRETFGPAADRIISEGRARYESQRTGKTLDQG